MTRLLLVEDDRLIGEMVRLNLQQQGYEVTWLADGSAGRQALLGGAFDLAVVDVSLPGDSGFEITRAARSAGLVLPILILTARSDTASKVTGLDIGADDYVTKPFDVPEFLARVRALLRRGPTNGEDAPRLLQLGPLEVDLDTGAATTRRGREVLDAPSRAVLEVLTRMRGQDLQATQILEELQSSTGPATDGTDAPAPLPTSPEALRDLVQGLRERFEPDPERPRHFLPVPGGYRFEG